jgi:trans-aconitate methyltransferase
MTSNQEEQRPKDHWTAKAYTSSASFVPKLTSTVIAWLDPQPHENILDIGCGDGVLTARIKEQCAFVTGVDVSSNLIEAARGSYGTIPNLIWEVQDCRYFEKSPTARTGHYDKVFSNAALHWILREPSTRKSVFHGAYNVLKPGGTFVFEMGGAGNVPEVHAALLAAVVHQGLSIQQARSACPWFFPSEELAKQMLEEAGFRLESSQLEYRPTELTTEEGGGIKGWVRLMGAQFFEGLSDEKREAAVNEVCEVLETVITHEQDGSKWLGYVRLRVLARKP